MCNICDGKKELDISFGGLNVGITGNVMTISYDAYSTDSSFDEDIVINFCPICGKKLLTYNENMAHK